MLSSDPFTAAALIESADDVDLATTMLDADHQGIDFVGVVAADDEAHLELILRGFERHLAEMIFTAPVASTTGLTGEQAGWLALDRFGVGQDFVFTVPLIGDALRYATERLTDPRGDPWTGTAVLVLGGAVAIDQARAVSLQPRPDEDAQ